MFLINSQLGLRKKRSAVIHFTSVAMSEIVVCGGDVSLGRRRALVSDTPLLILLSSSLKYHNFDTFFFFFCIRFWSYFWTCLSGSDTCSTLSSGVAVIWNGCGADGERVHVHSKPTSHIERNTSVLFSAVLDVSVVSLLVVPSCQQNVWLNQKCIWD